MATPQIPSRLAAALRFKAPSPPAKPQREQGNTAHRVTVSLFDADTGIIERLAAGLRADLGESVTTSEVIRALLRDAPAKLDKAAFFAHRANWGEEDGRARRGK
jgi:hypothetical protein